MSDYGTSDEHRPVTWINGQPIYAAYFVVLVFVVSMLLTTVALALNLSGALSWLTFSSGEVWAGQVWRAVSYGLVNRPSLFFVIDMFMMAWFGREVERFFGRRKFFTLYGGIYLLVPALFTLIGRWQPMYLQGEVGAFALFIAFATLFPNVVFFFGIPARWLAFVLVGIYTLMDIADRNLVALTVLWSSTGFAYAYVRYEQGHFSLPSFRLFRRRAKLRVLPDEQPARRESPAATVDALLDKIARSGISSLTEKERAQLDAARSDLLRRGSKR